MRNIDKLLEEMKNKKIDFPLLCHACPAHQYCHSLPESDNRKCGEVFVEWANMEAKDD